MFRPGPPEDLRQLPQRFGFLDVEVDRGAARATRAGRVLPLEPKAFDLLLLLAANPGRVVEKEEIFGRIWPDVAVTDNALARVVAHLRRELGDSADEARVVETVRTRGYLFRPEIRALDGPERAAEERAEVAAPRRPVRRIVAGALAATMAVAASTAVGVWLLRARHEGEPAPLPALRPLTHSRGFEGMPALSPDGASVAFVSDRAGPLEIFVVGRAPGSRPVRLTQDGGQNVQPAWSPDGQWLAFHSLRSGGIWVVPAGGGTARQVAPVGSAPAWSPDSRRLVFSSSEGSAAQATLWQVDRDGARLSQLTRQGAPAGGHHGPAWSRDGRTIAFGVFSLRTEVKPVTDHRIQLTEIWLLDLGTGGSRRFTAGPNYGRLQFAPDDRSLYWGGLSREGNPRLFRARLDAGAEAAPEEVLSLEPGWLDSLSVARDGTAALGISGIDANLWQIATSGETAGEPERLTDDSSRATLPSHSPDGSRLAFSVLAIGKSPSVWTMRAEGGERDLLGEGYQAEWDPGGGRLLVSSVGDFYWLDLATRRRGEALPLPRGAERLRLSPDGRSIAFHVEAEDGRLDVWTARADGGEPRQLTRSDEGISYPCWSADGRWLAVEIQRGGKLQLGVVPAAGGAARPLTSDRGQSWPHSWAPDSDRIAFAGERGGVWNVYSIRRTTGAVVQLTRFESAIGFVRYPAWSPRGDRIVFERATLSSNVWTTQLR